MPGAAALVLISGGSSDMTGIFSSTARLDSDETLAAGGTSVFDDDDAAATVEGAAVLLLLGLTFSLVAVD